MTAIKTRIVLPDGNSRTYDTVLQHRVGDPVTYNNSRDDGTPWFHGFNGYTVYDRHVDGDTVFLLVR